MNKYFFLEPFGKEGLHLKNRLVMTAMTRSFADGKHSPTDEMRAYYERRAAHDIGLILTEGTIVHPSGDGYPNVPYMYADEHVAHWKKVVDAVHVHGAKMFCQLWHCGRISHPDYLNGALPVSSSAIAAEGNHSKLKKPFVAPRALETEEIPEIIEMFVHATHRALRAGFDGVEIHAGHGYLFDQFFDSRINHRTDHYGGSIENRCRFALMTVERVLEIAGPTRTSVRISPSREMNGLYEWPDLEAMLDYVIPELDTMGLRILDVSSARSDYLQTSGRMVRLIRPRWVHILMAGASLSPEQADEEVKNGFIDLVTCGRHILANPDYIQKITRGEKLTPYDNEMLKSLY